MIYRKLAVFSIRYAKTVIIAWLCLALLLAPYALKLPSVLKDHGLRVEGSYSAVQRILSFDFHIPDEPVILLFEKRDEVSVRQFHQFIAQCLSGLQHVEGLEYIVSPLSRQGMEKGNMAYALLSFERSGIEMKRAIDEVKRLLQGSEQISVTMTGKPVVQEDVNRTSRSDLRKAEWIGIPAAFLILGLSFGGMLAALIPILVGVIGVTAAMGVMYVLGTKMDLSVFVLNVIPMAGLALSIDFALMLVSRFREELQRSGTEQAMIATMQSAGRTAVFSSGCVLFALAGTMFIRMPIVYTVALGAMVVLVISLLATLTLVPALLSLAARRLSKSSGFHDDSVRTRRWRKLSVFVMGHPVCSGLFAAIFLLCCILPVHRMDLAVPDAASLPKGYESRNASERFNSQFMLPDTSQVYVITDGRSGLPAYGLAERMKTDPDTLQVDTVISEKGNRVLISATIQGTPSSHKALEWVKRWERLSYPLPVQFGGEPKYRQEVFDEIFHNLKYVITFIAATNYLILFTAFRSVLIPVKTILMNFLSISAAFGLLVWIFQEGRFGMEPSSIAVMIPVFIFGLTFGISMDYGVFLLSRIAEIYRQTKDNDRAVREGLALTGSIITSAAAIMIAVTLPFGLGGVAGVKQLGTGIAAALLIDAAIVRILLVPPLMKWMGKWNWWVP